MKERESFAALILPAYLGIVSLISVIAATAVWVTRHNPNRGARMAQLLGQLGVLMLVLITLSALLVRPRTVTAVAPVNMQVTAENMGFAQTELLSENGQVTIQLTNRDLWWHTITIDELGIDLKVPMEATRAITFSAPPGTYQFYCSIPGHESIMQGTLTVK